MDASLSIIIVNYRSWHHLRRCLQNLITDVNQFEIIVVDNHSDDNLCQAFKSEFHNVLFIESQTNLGFGGGCHLGVSQASKEFLLFLNPDTIANTNAIQAMLDFIYTNKEFGIVSCRQHSNLSKHFLLLPSFPRLFGIWRSIETGLIKRKDFAVKKINGTAIIEPEWVSASVLMMSKKLYYDTGGWNKKLWMYYEDPDLCTRVKRLGFKIALITNYFIRHEHGGATRLNKSTAILSKGEVLISRHVYIEEHFKGIAKIASHILFIIEFIVLGTIKGLIGLIFLFIPVLNIHTHIWMNMIRYYINALRNKSWLSPKLNRI